MRGTELGVRWTVGKVSPEGFEALRLSILGAVKIFGPSAHYAVCVNTIPVQDARARAGDLPVPVRWIDASKLLPAWLLRHCDRDMAEGVAWKLAPVRVFPQYYEIALDNDCILWQMPSAISQALTSSPERCVLAGDVSACFGQFAPLCGPAPRNTGIRGTPAHFDLERSLQDTLVRCACPLRSEVDEQGLQVAALSAAQATAIVTVEEVSICSPFPPHSPSPGQCGAHFVGLNTYNLPWEYYGRPAAEVRREHWYATRELVAARVV
jgi:hypothetical protein